jgi:hypothetical protein
MWGRWGTMDLTRSWSPPLAWTNEKLLVAHVAITFLVFAEERAVYLMKSCVHTQRRSKRDQNKTSTFGLPHVSPRRISKNYNIPTTKKLRNSTEQAQSLAITLLILRVVGRPVRLACRTLGRLVQLVNSLSGVSFEVLLKALAKRRHPT